MGIGDEHARIGAFQVNDMRQERKIEYVRGRDVDQSHTPAVKILRNLLENGILRLGRLLW